MFSFHLILLAVLKNGWCGISTKGYTSLNYLGIDERIKFESGSHLSFKNVVDYAHYVRYIFHFFLELMVNNFKSMDESNSESRSDD